MLFSDEKDTFHQRNLNLGMIATSNHTKILIRCAERHALRALLHLLFNKERNHKCPSHRNALPWGQ